jgi:hypothetical protein
LNPHIFTVRAEWFGFTEASTETSPQYTATLPFLMHSYHLLSFISNSNDIKKSIFVWPRLASMSTCPGIRDGINYTSWRERNSVKALSLFQRCLYNYYYNVPFALLIREVHPQPHTSFVITNARSAQTDPQGKPTLVTTIKPTKAQHYAAPRTACPPAFGSCKMLKAQANIPPLSSLHT